MSEEPGEESTGATADEPTPPPAAPELAGLSPNQKLAFVQTGAVPPPGQKKAEDDQADEPPAGTH